MAKSADPLAAPMIRPKYLSAEGDAYVMLAGIRHTQRILASPAFAEHSVRELEPGKPIETVEDVFEFAKRNGASIYHPVGTCKMGEDPMAVVDPRLRVHGLSGLRVVDASIMPTVTTGNTNAPTIMIGEKGAEMVKEDQVA